MRGFRVEIEARIREQHEATRRHFDVMVEKVEAAVRRGGDRGRETPFLPSSC
jgi:hypothetical protein